MVEFLLNPRFLLVASLISSVLTLYLFQTRWVRGGGDFKVSLGNGFNESIISNDANLDSSNITGETPPFSGVELLWKACQDNFYRPPTVGSLTWVAGDKGVVYGIETKNGRVKFEFSIADYQKGKVVLPVFSNIISDESGVYVGEGEHHHKTGYFRKYGFASQSTQLSLKWEIPTAGHIEGGPVFHKNQIIFPSGSDAIYGADKETGKINWVIPEGEIGHFDNQLRIFENKIFAGTGLTTGFLSIFPEGKAHFLIFDAENGKILKKHPITSCWGGLTLLKNENLVVVPVGLIAKYRELKLSYSPEIKNGLMVFDLEGNLIQAHSTALPVTEECFPDGEWLYFFQEDTAYTWAFYDHYLKGSEPPLPDSNKGGLYRVKRGELSSHNLPMEKVFSSPQLVTGRGVVTGGKLLQVLKGGEFIGYDLNQKRYLFKFSIMESDNDWLFSSPVLFNDKVLIANSAFKAQWFKESLMCFKLIP